MKNRIQLGDRARDEITGYTGVVVARTEWLYGCVRLTLQAEELKDGKPVEAASFDEPQCVHVKTAVAPVVSAATRPGGPRPEPERGR